MTASIVKIIFQTDPHPIEVTRASEEAFRLLAQEHNAIRIDIGMIKTTPQAKDAFVAASIYFDSQEALDSFKEADFIKNYSTYQLNYIPNQSDAHIIDLLMVASYALGDFAELSSGIRLLPQMSEDKNAIFFVARDQKTAKDFETALGFYASPSEIEELNPAINKVYRKLGL